MSTQTVGSRELKVRLGTYLRRVQQGHRLVVTDRGRPVAEMVPVTHASGLDAILAEMEARGEIRRPVRKPLPHFRPIENRGAPASDAVIEDREDRF